MVAVIDEYLMQLDPGLCPLLSGVPSALTSAAAVCSLLRLLNSTKICIGNPDTQFLDIWKQRSLTLHGSSGKSSHALHTITQLTLLNFVQDLRVHSLMTSPYNVAQLSGIRHVKCQLLLCDENQAVLFSECVTY